MNPYDILEVTIDNTIDEIKNSYYKLARLYHPDKNIQNNSLNLNIQKFLEIQEAWNEIQKIYENNIPKLNIMSDIVDIKDLIRYDNYSYSYPCRCGDNYEIFIEDLEQNYNTFQCQGCSLHLTIQGYSSISSSSSK